MQWTDASFSQDPFSVLIHSQLDEKVKRTIITSQERQGLSAKACTIDELTTTIQAAQLKQTTSADEKKVLGFFSAAFSAMTSPLRRFKDALDTLCQASDVTNLIWGSMKVILIVSGLYYNWSILC